jgi:hypothetical protein
MNCHASAGIPHENLMRWRAQAARRGTAVFRFVFKSGRSGSSHVADGGSAAQELERLEDLVEVEDKGRGSGQLVESLPYLKADCQWAFSFQV